MIRLALIAPAILVGFFVIVVALAPPPGHLSAAGGAVIVAPRQVEGIPADYLALYRRAGATYGVDWAILAGIGSKESSHGRSTAPGVHSGQNFLGCCAGPMQFLNSSAFVGGGTTTWDAYGVDGDGDGDRDVYDPADAIPSAANYIRANLDASSADGAGAKLWDALYRYNRDVTYVWDVLRRADRYRGLSRQRPRSTEADVRPTGRLVGVPSDVAGPRAELIDSGIAGVAATIARQHGMQIVNGFRTPAHNRWVGGVRRSDHLCGLGVDFANGDAVAMRALEHWARGQKEFAFVLGPDSDPRGHDDHVHISFARCGED